MKIAERLGISKRTVEFHRQRAGKLIGNPCKRDIKKALVDHGYKVPGIKADPAKFRSLTLRQKQVAMLIGEGMSRKEIAFQLSISPRTVEFHIYNTLKILEIGDESHIYLFLPKPGEEVQTTEVTPKAAQQAA